MAWDEKNFDSHLDAEVRELLSQVDGDGTLPIVQMGEPVLRLKTVAYCGQLKPKTLEQLKKVMRRTMLNAPGVGLAGPQIGLGLSLAVVEDHIRDLSDDEQAEADEAAASADPRGIADFPFHIIINPWYEPMDDASASFFEGCLSFDGYQAVRKRWLNIKAHWFDEDAVEHEAELHQWPARIFQHETDHLKGEVYIDKAEIRSLTSYDNLDEYWAYDPVPQEASKVLGFKI
ncbi:peptide deformylase [Scardovia inopinata]|uniref:Peptide deformylase n=1 Tax=Scardovia inopinata F0304 TaxID=641146 RepID=W5IIR6_SCAIO|nr:peptide deformylase [Scardovia inopinata]EFG26767.1 hypothetical protein HMPREF9020_00394 [Scardovia inopinata F0304]BAR06370.1 peptide deformylase [Scardovia inopinata JCM 12537]SUV51887.1 peptide deformylase [Scardovia inopinata]